MHGPLQFFMPTVAHYIGRIRGMTSPMHGSDEHCLSVTGFVSPRALYLVVNHVDLRCWLSRLLGGRLAQRRWSLFEPLGNDAAGNVS